MHLKFSDRMILYNVLFFIITFALIIFLVIQGITFQYINGAREQLMTMGQDVNLYVTQEVGNKKEAPRALFEKNAGQYASYLAMLENNRTRLFDLEGNTISDSLSTTDGLNLTKELKKAEEAKAPAMTLTSANSLTTVYYVSPVRVNDETLGYVGFVYYLEEMDAYFEMTYNLFIFGGLLGLFFLIIAVMTYSRHLVAPIRDLTKISKEITAGNYNVNIHYSKEDEIGDLTQVFNQMSGHINSVVKQLKSERERLASVLASIDDGLLAIDAQGNIITYNSYIKTYFNVSHPETIYDFKYQSFLRDIFDRLKKGKEHISEEIDCNGRNLLIIGSPIHNAGFEENYMLLIRNISATKQLENEQRKFISSVSHELRTPLTTIIGYTDMLQRRGVEDKNILNNSLSTINREGHRLLRLVDDLINVHSFDQIAFDIKKTNVDIQALLHDVVEQMRIKAWQKEIEINYKSDESLPEILGDYDRLSQVIINILHNAIKYSEKGGIIEVISTLEGDSVVISIRDYGIGISDTEKDQIFNAFYRVEEDRARSEGEGGAGLGLYIVKEIIEKHNGELSIESQVGEGTNITVTLPLMEKTIGSEVSHDEA